MLDAEEIAVEIARLEYEPSSWSNYSKLADLYALRDHSNAALQPEAPRYSGYSFEGETISAGGSDFLAAANGKPTKAVLSIMDELMTTLEAVNERVYNSVIRKIRDL